MKTTELMTHEAVSISFQKLKISFTEMFHEILKNPNWSLMLRQTVKLTLN